MESHHQAKGLIEQVLQPLVTRRVVVVAAHPDDETIGAGGQLARFQDAYVIHVTDGAPRDSALWPPEVAFSSRESYARLRAQEGLAAMALAGVTPSRVHCLGIVDQEAAHQLPSLTCVLMQLFDALEPEAVLVQPYEGGHPDQDAAAFAVAAAVALLRARSGWGPALVEMSAYHGPNGHFTCGDFLPGGNVVATLPLSGADLARKRRMVRCFASQRRALEHFPVDAERFRMAPRYDFSKPPHRGRLYYESLGWPLTGEGFRELAREAVRELFREGEAAWP